MILNHQCSYCGALYQEEGIVIYHTAGNLYFKKTIENDEKYKGK
jgi:hypothetical protein